MKFSNNHIYILLNLIWEICLHWSYRSLVLSHRNDSVYVLLFTLCASSGWIFIQFGTVTSYIFDGNIHSFIPSVEFIDFIKKTAN